jgi:hypothetical protein
MNNKKSLPIAFTEASIDHYCHLRLEALRRVRAYNTRTERAYHHLLDKGISPLQSFMESVAKAPLTTAIEKAFAQAAHIRRYTTIKDMLNLAARRFDYRPAGMKAQDDALLTKLSMGGAIIHKLMGNIVLNQPVGSIALPYAPATELQTAFAPKTRTLIKALETLHVFSDDLVITSSIPRPGALGQQLYTLITIPKLGRQIAICDQTDKATFVSTKIHSVATWAGKTKEQLLALPGIDAAEYDANKKWLKRTLASLSHGIKEIQKTTKAKLPRRLPAPLLTEDTIVRWIRATHAKTRKWPAQGDKKVWDTNEKTGEFVLVEGKNWLALDTYCRKNLQGLENIGSFSQLKDKYNLNNKMSEDILIRWIKATKEKTGKWPNQNDMEVWDKDEQTGEFTLVKEKEWHNIDMDCRHDLQGLHGLGSLSKFKKKHGLEDHNILPEETLVRWIKATHEKLGKGPSHKSKEVWDKDEQTGEFHLVEGENWTSLNNACRENWRGLQNAGSIAQLKAKHGIYDAIAPGITL